MMTGQSLFKSLVLPTLLLITVLAHTGCGNRDMNNQQVSAALNEQKPDANKERDGKFMVQAAEINFDEIMLAKLAQQRTVDDNLKGLARMLEEAHRTANVDLRALARQKSIAVPTAATNTVMENYDKLNLNSTEDFDNAYFTMVIQHHESNIRCFESYINGHCDEAIKAWAMNLLPELRSHLQKAKDLQPGISGPVSML